MPSDHLILCRLLLPSVFPSLIFKLNRKFFVFFLNFPSIKYQLCFFSFYTNTSSCGIFLKVVPPSFEPDHLHRAGSPAISSQPWREVFLFVWFQDKPLTFVQRSVLWSGTYVRKLIEVDWHPPFTNCYLLRFSFGFLWQHYISVWRIWQCHISAGFCVFNIIIAFICSFYLQLGKNVYAQCSVFAQRILYVYKCVWFLFTGLF